jgi:hypothetical protein
MKTYSQSITAALLLTGGVALALLGLRPVAPVEVVRSSLSQTTAPATPTAVPLLDTSGRISTSTCAGVPPPQAVATLPAIARPTAPPPAKDAALKALPSAEQQSLWKAFAEARHAVDTLTDTEKSLPQNQGVAYFAHNPGQKVIARFLADGGVRLGSGLRDHEWQATLKLDTSQPSIMSINNEWEDIVVMSEPIDPATTPQLFGRVEVLLPAP